MIVASPARIYALHDALVDVELHEPPGGGRRVPEALVHDLWARLAFERRGLCTTDGTPIIVLDPGRLNQDGGPDFRMARLKIGPTLWCGDVEIHVTSAEWRAHGHDRDARYNSVVLHVTLQQDNSTGCLRRADGSPLPEVVLHPRLHAPLRQLLYAYHTQPPDVLPCAAQIGRLPAAVPRAWMRTLGRLRLRTKADRFRADLTGGLTFEEALYRALFRGLGYAPNADTMQLLAERLPLALLREIARADSLDGEALVLGTAGFLGDDAGAEPRVVRLRENYRALRPRYGIDPLPRTLWQFFRLRPANFPPLRIVQGLTWVQPGGLLGADLACALRETIHGPAPLPQLRTALRRPVPPFWTTHVRLDRPSAPHAGTLGRSRADVLIADVVIPAALALAYEAADLALERAALTLATKIPAPRNAALRRYEALDLKPENAAEAGGLIHLHQQYCAPVRCLACQIGRHLMGGSS